MLGLRNFVLEHRYQDQKADDQQQQHRQENLDR